MTSWRLLLALLAASGCHGTVVGEDPGLRLPDVAGTWTGGFAGDLGVPGSDVVLRDTFGLTFTVVQDQGEFGYEGEVRRGPSQEPLYDCAPRLLAPPGDERHLQVECVQATQLGESLVLRVIGDADPGYEVLRGVVRDRDGVDGEMEIVLTRDAHEGR